MNISLKLVLHHGSTSSIRILSAPAELVIYVLAGLYLGLQKTITSSLMISIFCFGNIILSTLFVVHLDLEIFGVAAGTTIAAYSTVIIFLIFTYFLFLIIINASSKAAAPIAKKLFKLFNINVDIFIRTILLTSSFLWMTHMGFNW